MTKEVFDEAIAEINKFNALDTSTLNGILSKHLGLAAVGIAIEVDPRLTEEERDGAREYLLNIRARYRIMSDDSY